MKCSKCNAEIDDSAIFCPECGSKIEKTAFCANCGAKLETGAVFCSNCGEKISHQSNDKKICPYCGEEILATATKCKHCGEWLDDEDDEEDDNNTNDIAEEDNLTILKQNVPLSNGLIKTALWVAIVGLFISYFHTLIEGLGLENISIGGIGMIFSFFYNIP